MPAILVRTCVLCGSHRVCPHPHTQAQPRDNHVTAGSAISDHVFAPVFRLLRRRPPFCHLIEFGRHFRQSLDSSRSVPPGSPFVWLSMAETVADTRRLHSKPQNLNDAYGPPSNFLEIDVSNPQTVGVGRNRYTTYEVRLKTNLPIFKLKESCVRRRYSDFEWLRSELERESKVVVPPLPGKALFRQLPFRGDEGIFDESFIEDRKLGLEQFINKVAGHPLAQNERCLHMFLQDEIIDRNYTPSKIRHA
ncbi:sorting nexin-3 [Dendrobates tinctorius]|uniref:sorting nexin-3 n=1 Tax=Dendrobates tinctorius TaxID=92724 RepID=UPI003CC92FF0